MKITDTMLVPERADDSAAEVRTCRVEGTKTFHIPQTVMVLSAGGARRLRLWTCENHPLPETVTDKPDEG